MNTYRVDRAQEGATVPIGMNSIVYIGDDAPDAHYVFDLTEPGKDEWNQPNCTYGVMFSVWNELRGEYTVKRYKGK